MGSGSEIRRQQGSFGESNTFCQDVFFFILGNTGSEQLPWSAYVLSSSLYSGVIIVVKYGASRSFPKSMAIAPRNLNTHVL